MPTTISNYQLMCLLTVSKPRCTFHKRQPCLFHSPAWCHPYSRPSSTPWWAPEWKLQCLPPAQKAHSWLEQPPLPDTCCLNPLALPHTWASRCSSPSQSTLQFSLAWTPDAHIGSVTVHVLLVYGFTPYNLPLLLPPFKIRLHSFVNQLITTFSRLASF